ncbi:glycine cleavage system protein GcvH [Marinobacterium sp. YM272]|uniref:glycine cleavage system protein GcvH n=1 Tax=Marinobacterium sp. YM272 TaxID=3421654 RepID=UPI003D7F8120
MSNVPTNLKYAKSHEWVLEQGDGIVTVGISDHAQELLGDVVFVELPEVGTEVSREQEFALVESVKAASDIYAPVAGEVIEVNEALNDSPEVLNEEPYEGGWLVRIRLEEGETLDHLLDADTYTSEVAD